MKHAYPPISIEIEESVTSVFVTGSIHSDYNLLTQASIQLFQGDKPVTEVIPTPSGQYEAWTDAPGSVAISFSAPGYKSVLVPFTTLQQSPDVELKKGLSIPGWQIAIVFAAVILYINKEKKKGRTVGALTTGDLLPIFLLAGGVIGFSLIKKILESIGLWDSKDTKDLDDQASNPNNFWNPTYWQTIKPADKNWTYAITQATADSLAKDIYNSFGPFNDCEECVKAIFKQFRTKANASFLAWQFNNRYGYDLLDFLRGGIWPQDRLSDSDVNEINQYLSRLPNY